VEAQIAIAFETFLEVTFELAIRGEFRRDAARGKDDRLTDQGVDGASDAITTSAV
jgi:hypothetical protein